MKNHEGINYVHFPYEGFAFLIEGDNIKKVREITDEGGNMLSYVKTEHNSFSLKFKCIYTPLGKPSISMPKISTFLGNNKLFTYNDDKSYVKDGATFKILDCTTLEVLYTSPKIVNLNVIEEIIEFDGQILDTSTMKFVDVNPRDTYTINYGKVIEITRYEGAAIELPYFEYNVRGMSQVFIYENYIITEGCEISPIENAKCVNYKLIKLFNSGGINICNAWRIESIKKPKAALPDYTEFSI